jgi:hypothetical protein
MHDLGWLELSIVSIFGSGAGLTVINWIEGLHSWFMDN